MKLQLVNHLCTCGLPMLSWLWPQLLALLSCAQSTRLALQKFV